MRVHLLSMLLVLGLAGRAKAQENCIDEIKVPAVGGWAEYKAVFKDKEPYTMRYAVIGEESREGKPLKWLEVRTEGNKKDGDIVYQTLVPGSASKLGDVEEIVMKHGDKPAMKVDGMMLQMIREQMQKKSFLSEVCKDVKFVATETVTVPAGKFKSRHFHSDQYTADSWIAAGVPFSMVKAVGKDHELTLTRHGDGAKSSITEKPQDMGAGMGSQARSTEKR